MPATYVRVSCFSFIVVNERMTGIIRNEIFKVKQSKLKLKFKKITFFSCLGNAISGNSYKSALLDLTDHKQDLSLTQTNLLSSFISFNKKSSEHNKNFVLRHLVKFLKNFFFAKMSTFNTLSIGKIW